jgi:sulfite exporter TauE/SafE
MPRSLFLISTAVALALLGDQMLYTVLPVVHEAVGVPVTAVGLLLGANRLVRLVTNTFAGYMDVARAFYWLLPSSISRRFVATRSIRRQLSSRCPCERILPLGSVPQCRPEGVWWLV